MQRRQKERLQIQTLTKMENIFDGFISRLSMGKEKICVHEYRSIRTSKLNCKERKEWKKEQDIWELWDNCIRYNIHILSELSEEEREKGTEEIFEITTTGTFQT